MCIIMNQYDYLRTIGNKSPIGRRMVVLSIEMGNFVDRKLFLRLPSIIKVVFMDGRFSWKHCFQVISKIFSGSVHALK